MGGKVSVHDEDGQNIRQYAEPIDGGADEPLTGLDTRNHWLTRAMRARIVYVTIFGCFIGLGIPLILYWANKPSGPGPIYGSCLIKSEFRFKCLINQFADPTEDQCIDAMCCWENNNTLPFKCYHSLNPAYQYHVDGDFTSQNQETLRSKVPDQSVEFNIKPNYKERMTNLRAKLVWENTEQLNIQIFDPEKFPQGIPTESSSEINSQLINGDISIKGLDVTFSGKSGDYFYIRIGRNETGETIFDTRIGPLISTGNDISFATILPTQYFHGLRGGQENGPIIYDVVNGRNSMDLPFYMPLEKSGKVSGILFETPAPFIVQFVEAPALMFHFEGARVGLNMRFFVGPTVKDVTRQLTAYLSKEGRKFEIPPYWALGLHLCQQLLAGEDALEQIIALERISPLVPIPFDSHCVEIDLRNPFRVDEEKYNKTVVDKIINHLLDNKKRLLLAQKIGLDEKYYSEYSNSAPLINWPNKTALLGLNEGKKVYYPNMYHEDLADWLDKEFMEFEDMNITIFENSSGLVFVNNFPMQENSIKACPNVGSRLQRKFMADKDGLVCPNARHFLTEAKTDSRIHFDIHNEYGHETVGKFIEAYQKSMGNKRIITTSSSIRPNTFVQSGFNGLSVPFTWNGMIDSLAHILRNFMMLRFVGTPICGNYMPSDSPRNDDELCLRWFQMGLLLPFARNTYGKNITRGPLDFNMNDQKNLIDAIQERYRYNPYYYTLFHLFNETDEPLIRPLAYDFHEEPPVSFNILTQFMIGPALMAAPILSKAATTRDAYFPAGVWFEASGGKLVYDNLAVGATLTIPGLASTTPLFLRGGHVVPTLTTPIASTGEESRSGEYTILATFPQHGTDVPSKGVLFIDEGVESDFSSHKVEFTVTNKSITIRSNCNSKDPTNSISTTINQIKIFGFPQPQPEVKSNVAGQIRPDITYSEEDMVLRMKTCGVDWCTQPNIIFTWDLN